MKELTIEEKAKAYDEAIKIAKEELKEADAIEYNLPDSAHAIRTTVYSLFPELKDGEDEGIWIINYLSNRILNSTIIAEKENLKKAIAWLENQVKQNLANSAKTCKVEPKFKIGDWVINTITKEVEQVIELTDTEYICSGHLIISFTADGLLKRWTIQDAKDGDVLAAHECYVIFKEIDGLNIKCYCTYYYMGFNPSFYVVTLQNKEAFHPATKEQRDDLMKAVSDAGYEWDAEKKELSRLEEQLKQL